MPSTTMHADRPLSENEARAVGDGADTPADTIPDRVLLDLAARAEAALGGDDAVLAKLEYATLALTPHTAAGARAQLRIITRCVRDAFPANDEKVLIDHALEAIDTLLETGATAPRGTAVASNPPAGARATIAASAPNPETVANATRPPLALLRGDPELLELASELVALEARDLDSVGGLNPNDQKRHDALETTVFGMRVRSIGSLAWKLADLRRLIDEYDLPERLCNQMRAVANDAMELAACAAGAGGAAAAAFAAWQDLRRRLPGSSDDAGDAITAQLDALERAILTAPARSPADHCAQLAVLLERAHDDGRETNADLIAELHAALVGPETAPVGVPSAQPSGKRDEAPSQCTSLLAEWHATRQRYESMPGDLEGETAERFDAEVRKLERAILFTPPTCEADYRAKLALVLHPDADIDDMADEAYGALLREPALAKAIATARKKAAAKAPPPLAAPAPRARAKAKPRRDRAAAAA
jgi:hypothetical protein